MPYIRSVKQIKQTLHFLRVRSEATTRVLVFPPVNNYHRFLIHKVSPYAAVIMNLTLLFIVQLSVRIGENAVFQMKEMIEKQIGCAFISC